MRSLTDVMSHAGLSGYAIVALLLFLVAFVGIAVRVFRRSSTQDFEEARRLPLEDEPAASQPERSAR